MEVVGLRELRDDASALVRRVEAGEEIEIVVAGRPAARLVPVTSRRWQRWDDIARLFTDTTDPEWNDLRGSIDHSVIDWWDRR